MSWPVAVFHGLGTGTDTKQWWMLLLTVACVAAVVVAVGARIIRSNPDNEAVRVPALALTVLDPRGDRRLHPRRTAREWLGAARRHPDGRVRQDGRSARREYPGRHHRPRASAPRPRRLTTLKAPFSARVSGTVTQSSAGGGSIVDLALTLSGGAHGRLRVRMAGAPINGGGLSMTGSQVDLLAVGLPSVMEGQIVSLQGQQFLARVADSAGNELELHANLTIDNNSRSVSGTLAATNGGGH